MKIEEIQLGKYQHHKNGKLYDVIGVARHSETCEEMIVYTALYHCDIYGTNQLWVRPKSIFFQNMGHDGQEVPRFKWVGD